jgi:hypothetical protein
VQRHVVCMGPLAGVFFGLWFVCFAVLSVYTGMYIGDSRTNPREGGGGVTPSPATVPEGT